MSELNGVGIGLKPQHFESILDTQPAIDWFEIHPENYMGDGGPHHYYLAKICEHYPLSMHGVSLSIGSADGVCDKHLQRLKHLINQYEPVQFSEHLSWSHWQQQHHHDLLPLPYTKESLRIASSNIERTQDVLGRRMLIENPSTYMSFTHSDFNEAEFINTLCEKTGCGILLDINNVYVSSQNNHSNAHEYLSTINTKHIGEIHLAGHEAMPFNHEKDILIDNHGSPICSEVWELYSYFIKNHYTDSTNLAVLIERDVNIPALEDLVEEAQIAKSLLQVAA